MDVQREQADFSAISGTSLRLSERDTIAIYRWGGLSWVAQFRDGDGELNDAATWFRVHAGLLRSSRVGSVAAFETVEMLTPEMISKIAGLHERVSAQSERRVAALTAPAVAFCRACAQKVRIANPPRVIFASLVQRGRFILDRLVASTKPADRVA